MSVAIVLRDVELAAPADGEPTELVFDRAHLQLAVVAGEEDPTSREREIEAFAFTLTDATDEGEPAPDAIRVLFSVDVETARLLFSSGLDYLEQHRANPSTPIHVAGVHELTALEGGPNRAARRRRGK